MPRKVILFNGPPSSGKDTMGMLFVAHLKDSTLDKFAAPLKNAVGAFLGFDEQAKQMYFETPEGKNTEHFGFNIRQALIDFSEDYAKPRYGKDIFGRLMLQRIMNSEHKTTIITDCGFATEIEPLIESMGKENIILFRMHREGCDFRGDSRGYLHLGLPNEHDIQNNGSPRDTFNAIRPKIENFLHVD